MSYSKLVSWEVYNFMVYSYAKCEFDDRGIITIKGYNDSGKSTMLLALTVLMFNLKPNQQVSFIKDDCDYFRIVAHFDDGVTILRDKYINGQSLYEMYKDDQVIFSTKNGKALTKVSAVPEPIEKYLGLIAHDGTCLNSRSCIDKQLLVQTTGSENYKLLNVILKSEELAVATQMLNDDKNRVLQDINSTESKLNSAKEIAGVGTSLTDELISSLESMDKDCDIYEQMINSIIGINNLQNSIDSIKIIPEISPVDCTQFDELLNIDKLIQALSKIQIYPELNQVDSQRLDLLQSIITILSELSTISELPKLSSINTEQLDMLISIWASFEEIKSLSNDLDEMQNRLMILDKEMNTCVIQMGEFGKKVIKCPNCGTVYDSDEEHVDVK